jgi:hypothetical protein
MKSEDNIEQLIRDKISLLNSDEPQTGHFERFEKRMNKHLQIRYFNKTMVFRIAAAVIFMALMANQIRIWILPPETHRVTLASVSPEYAEIEYYYTNAIQNGLNTWNNLTSAGIVKSEESKVMQKEIREFEQLYEELQLELQANPYDERVIEAMLNYYHTKLNLILMIINKLQEIEHQKIMSHETEV